MIPAQIGEHRGVHGHPCHPLLIQAVGRDFHGHSVYTLVPEFRQQPLRDDGIRRRHAGVGQRNGPAQHPSAQGSDNAGRRFQHCKQLRQQVGAGGLAVGAGDPRDGQCRAGLAVKAPGNGADPRRQPGHRDHRNPEYGQRVGVRGQALLLCQHGNRAGRRCGGDEIPAIPTSPGQGKKDIAGHDIAAVEREPPNPEPRQGAGQRGIRQQVGQPHIAVVARCGHHPAPARVRCAALAVRSAATSDSGAGGSGGCTANRRSAAEVTRANTGAATTPPK